VLLLAAVAPILVSGWKRAEAGFTSESKDALVKYLESDAAFNLKLMALDALRKKTSSGIEDELEDLAAGDDLPLAIYATTALGKKKTSDAKASLKWDLRREDGRDFVRNTGGNSLLR
jgi:hypothetical protein